MAQPDRWSRRRLLTARGLGASTGGAIAALLPEVAVPTTDDRSASQWRITRRAMACDFTVHLPHYVRDPVTVATTALSEIEQLEDLLTVYRDDSEISRVNALAARRPVRTDGRVFALLELAADLWTQTDGAFDVACGAMIKSWGFFKPPRRVPSEAEHADVMTRCGMRHVSLNGDAQTVHYAMPGVEINLGSIGKGYALDRAARRLRDEHGLACGLLTGGSSSMLAMGSLWDDENGWLIAIEDPADPSQAAATVRLKNRALGTSSGSNQHFEIDGRRYGHLLDPRTGYPADVVASASAIAPDAATADALATAFYVWGLDKTAEFCHNHPDIAAIIVLRDGPRCPAATPPADTRPGMNRPANDRTAARVVTFNLSPKDVTLGMA